jgi:hypothetical protein
MKHKLLFIDNDIDCEDSQRDVKKVKRLLSNHGCDRESLDNMKLVFDFRNLKKQEQISLLADEEYIIVTYSMFTSVHYNSQGQLQHFLELFGRNNIKDRTYIDCSGYLYEAIERAIRDSESQLDILVAIQTNTIIGKNDEQEFHKVELRLEDQYSKLLKQGNKFTF